MPRAFLRVGGATLARHQLALALSAGCERIACLAKALEPELVELQHEAERAGARFHMISGGRALSGLVTANDELLVLSDGLVPSPADALELIERAPTVLVLPAESAVPAGFERIDLNHAGAGLMVLPGRLIERLNDLPSDADPVSSLLRIALQAGITQRLVPQSVTSNSRWLLVRDEDAAHAAENGWMERHTAGKGRTAGQALAAFATRRFGPALLHAGSGSRALAVAALAFVLIGAGAGWFGYAALGLGLCAPAWLAHRSAVIIGKIQNDALGTVPQLLAREAPFEWLLDVIIAGLLVVAIPALPGEPLWQRCFAPIMLLGLFRLVPGAVQGKWALWLGDRMILALLLCGLTLGKLIGIAVPALAAMLLFAGILFSRKAIGITRA